MKYLLLALLLVAVGCADRSATQYVGSVTRIDAPESEGALRLTFFTRSDTSFGGVIELAEPARGTGSAYAWFEGSELNVVTVGGQTSDTILWTSRISNSDIGGQFRVLGGDRKDQTGTWRARLVHGLPATKATLGTPKRVPVPTMPSAFVAIAVLIAAGIGVAQWVRRAPVGVREDGQRWYAPPAALNDIGGWLALFVVGQLIAILVSLTRGPRAWTDYVKSILVAGLAPGGQALVVLETGIYIVAVPLIIGGLVLLMRRSPYAPRYWYAYFLISATYVVVDLLWGQSFQLQLHRLTGPSERSEAMDRLTSNQLRLLVGSMIWLLYWVRSRRVRATFGAAALDKTVIAWPEGQDNATTAVDARAIVRNARWWGRMAVRTLGVLAAAVVVLLMIGLWVSHSSAYAAPNGDIRAAVAGRWTWAADTAGCRDAHVIAFPDSGKVMTIATRDMAGGVKLTTYDILLQTSSTIRGAIRGETRMTAAGKPVIWDLVLTGPDEYRWKRTDWTSTPWSYTGPIHRCPALTVSDSGAS